MAKYNLGGKGACSLIFQQRKSKTGRKVRNIKDGKDKFLKVFREVYHVLYFLGNRNDAISDYHDQILKEGSCGSMCGSITIVIKKDISM